jgi:hypothetical protein
MSLFMTNAMAGNFYATGHDVLLHDGQNGYDEVILDYLRGAGTPGEIPEASYSIAVIGSNVGFWGWTNVPGFSDKGTGANTPPGYASTTFYDTAALDGNAALQAAALSHDLLIILSHTSCGGCDLSTAGSAVINTQMAAGIAAAFNSGMDLWAMSGASLATYYDFLPPGFAASGPPIGGSSGFVATPAGVAIGIIPGMINGFQTHNRFTGFAPTLTVMEIRPDPAGGPDEDISIAAQDISFNIEADIDIKFCSDPNAFNCKKKGVLPVTIFGSDQLDVLEIDISTLRLCLEDESACTGAPKDWSIDDRGDPTTDLGAAMCAVDPETGEQLDSLNPDGYWDLDAAFEAQEVQDMLFDFCGGPTDGASPTLIVVGETTDGTPIVSVPIGNTGIDQLVKKNH